MHLMIWLCVIPLNCDWSFESNMVILQVPIFNHEQPNILCSPSTSSQCMDKEEYKQLPLKNQNTPPLQGSRALPQAIVHLLKRIRNHKLLQPKLNTGHSYSRKGCTILQTYRQTLLQVWFFHLFFCQCMQFGSHLTLPWEQMPFLSRAQGVQSQFEATF
jgi:hypothetical protein